MRKSTRFITQAGIIAALYTVFTMFIAAFGLASGSIQVRISEALCILPVYTPAAIPGLWIGCLLSNILTGGTIYDVIFGSLATLLGALGTYALRKYKFIYTLPPVISNMIIIPLVLKYGLHLQSAGWFLMITIGIGEAISICVLGTILKKALDPFRSSLYG